MCQGGKVGSSAAGELSRSKDNVIVSVSYEGLDTMSELRNMVKHFEFYQEKEL